jgi:glycerol-3-phosphate dehydrogenase
MMFAIPRDGKTYIGTTDTNYTGSLEQPEITKEDIEYILNGANYMFPSIQLTPEDVESGWAGLRPLIHEEGKSPSELSRKDEVFVSESNLISIAGGKLTGFRKMAERIVDLICSQLSENTGTNYPKCTTDKITLSGGNLGGARGFSSFQETWINAGQELGLSKNKAQILVKRYGSNVSKVYRYIKDYKHEAKNYELDIELLASLHYGIKEEMVTDPDDFLIRRTGKLYFNVDDARRNFDPVLRYMSDLFKWEFRKTNEKK